MAQVAHDRESMAQTDRVEIPNQSLFRAAEVCEIASVQPYVLRSWEAEFPDLGVSKVQGAPRVYRREDVERVLRIKQLLFAEGLTLAGARRKLQEERPASADEPAMTSLAELLGKDARERIVQVKQGLRSLAAMLARRPGVEATDDHSFELKSSESPERSPVALRSKTAAKKVAKARKKR
jgi:DNA-binding transcriptional MerR regulator